MKMDTARFGEIAEFINGRAFKPSEWSRSGLPIIRIQNLTGTSEGFNFFNGTPSEQHMVRSGDLLISWSASLGVYRWSGRDAVLNQHIFKVRLNDHVDETFFFYGAQHSLSEMESRVHGSTMQHITKDQFDSLPIRLPPLAEQRRIAAQLEQADSLRRTRRYTLDLSDTFLPATFRRMFGDVSKIVPLDECAEIVSGIAKGQKYGERPTVEAPYLRVANVQDGFLDLSEIKFIEALPEDVAQLTLQPGDVLMTEGGDYDKLGRGAVWRGEIEGCIHQNHVFRVRLDSRTVLPVYFAEFLKSAAAKSYFLSCAKQTTNLASINMTQLRATPLPVPSLSQQQAFASIVREHERLRSVQRESLRQAEHLFQTLLHRAFAA
ncbi:MAG: restriction endonuclease subunit S [Verrucomicrobiaceae bacterium]